MDWLKRISDIFDAARGKRRDSYGYSGNYWQNQYTGLGTGAFDPTTWMQPGSVAALAAETLASLALGDPIAATIVGAIVDDSMSGGYTISYDGETADEDMVDEVVETAEALAVEDRIRRGAKSGRATGFGGIVLGVGGDPASPIDRYEAGPVDDLVCVDARDLIVSAWRGDRPATYQIHTLDREYAGITIDASRLIAFGGLDTPFRDKINVFNGFDESVLQLVWETIRDFRGSWQSAMGMMANASQTVLKIPRLWEVLAAKATALSTRLHEIAMQRQINRIMALDAGGGGDPSEELAEVARTFAGIPDLLLEQKTLVAQAAGMPVTRLFGVSPAGLNATGEADERSWMRSYTSWRRMRIEPQILRLIRLIASGLGARDPEGWGVEWREVEILTSRESAEIEEIHARTDEVRLRLGMSEDTILRHRYEGEYRGTAPVLTEEDIAELEAMAEEPEPEPEPEIPIPPQIVVAEEPDDLDEEASRAEGER